MDGDAWYRLKGHVVQLNRFDHKITFDLILQIKSNAKVNIGNKVDNIAT